MPVRTQTNTQGDCDPLVSVNTLDNDSAATSTVDLGVVV